MTLRSKTVDLVYQELWGLLLAYNVVRREASQAAVAHKRAPSEVSFKFACQHIASHLVVMAGAVSPSHTPRRLEELRGSKWVAVACRLANRAKRQTPVDPKAYRIQPP
ncbi:ISSod7 [Pseudomonas amygdali pv. morsprunorum str. M302280]|nr:ISSod7 [Pseudomonas amygdali pv. morsprunorum str. M302280]